MLGFKILLHSVRLILRNWRVALRLSSPLVLLLVLSPIVFGVDYLQQTDSDALGNTSGASSTIAGLLQFLAGLWVAVAWHRYVLMEEDSGALIPPLNAARIVAYFTQGLKIFLLLLCGGILTAILLAVLGSSSAGESASALIVISVIVGAFWVFYRLSPVLPAAALDTQASIRGAWNVTRSLSGAILVLVLLLGVLSFVLVVVIEPIQYISGPMYLALSSIQIWFTVMVGVSILTTIYGVAVENRAL